MSFRFRVSTQSALGRRLIPLGGSERRDLFRQVVEAGLRALSASYAESEVAAKLDRILEEAQSQRKELAAIASQVEDLLEFASLGDRPNADRATAPSISSSRADDGVTEMEFRTLLGTLGSIGAVQPAPS